MNGIKISYILIAKRADIFVRGPLTYAVKRKQLQRKLENVCKTVTSNNVENKKILHLNG